MVRRGKDKSILHLFGFHGDLSSMACCGMCEMHQGIDDNEEDGQSCILIMHVVHIFHTTGLKVRLERTSLLGQIPNIQEQVPCLPKA